MLKNNKKRVDLNYHQPQFVDEKAMNRVKYQNLLEDFFVLQKEFVSKKRKLQRVKQKRDVLLAEVRFLRQRHKFLTKMQCHNLQLASDPVSEKASCMEDIKSSPIEDLDPVKYSYMQYQGDGLIKAET